MVPESRVTYNCKVFFCLLLIADVAKLYHTYLLNSFHTVLHVFISVCYRPYRWSS